MTAEFSPVGSAPLLALSLLALLAPTQAGLVAPGANFLRRRAPPRRACVAATTDPFADVADTDELTLDEDEYEEEVMVLDEDEAAAWAQPPSSPPPDEADGWAEPMASAEQAAEEVDSVLKYYPQLLRAKYGDDWEALLGDDDDDDDDAAADAAGGDAADADAEAPRAAYVGEVEMDTDWEESEERVEGMTEEELAQLVATQQAEEDRLEAEGGGAADAAADDDDEEEDDDPTTVDEAALAAATALSDDLSSWSRRLALGDVSVPKPFPESEWLHVWACAAAPSRFVNLRASWANVRARLPANFDDFECAAAAQFGARNSLPRAIFSETPPSSSPGTRARPTS